MAARFKLDENLPREAQALLLKAGCDAHSVHDEKLAGAPDDKIFDACQNENRILVTLDLDFADIRRYPPSSHHGGMGAAAGNPKYAGYSGGIAGRACAGRKEPADHRLWIVGSDRVRING